jgi:hypothetical protein
VCHRTVSGAPSDSVRCTRVLQLELFTFGFPRRSSAIIHWTVRCATGLSGAPTEQRLSAQRSTLQSEQWNSDVRAASQRGTGLSGVPPDCPVHQRSNDYLRNGRLCKVNSGIQMSEQRVRGASDCPVCHRTVRCHMRTKPPTDDQLQDLTAG